MTNPAQRRRLILGALLIVHAIVIFARIHKSNIFSDDYLNFQIYKEMGFGLRYLMRDVFGQVAPAYRLTQAVYFETFGTQFVPAMGILIFLSVLSNGLLFAILKRVGASDWAAFSGCIVNAFLLQPTEVQLWWSAALHTVFSLTAVLGTLFVLAKPTRLLAKDKFMAAALFLIALAFTAKALFAIVVFAAVMVYARRNEGMIKAVRTTAIDLLCLAVPVAFFGLEMIRFAPGTPTHAMGWTIPQVIAYVWTAITDVTLAATIGLGSHGADISHGVAMALLMFIAMISAGFIRQRETIVLWIGVLGYAVIATAVVATQRVVPYPLSSHWLRYGVENATFVVLAAALTVDALASSRFAARITMAAAILVAVNLQIQSQKIQLPDETVAARSYVGMLQASLHYISEQPNIVILDTEVPAAVMPAWMERYRKMSVFIPLFTNRFLIADESNATYHVLPTGRIVPIEKIAFDASSKPHDEGAHKAQSINCNGSTSGDICGAGYTYRPDPSWTVRMERTGVRN